MSYAAPPVPGTASLDQPLYGASIGQAASRFFKKYATFSGRASRSEFWWWFLIAFVVSAILNGIGGATSNLTDPSNVSYSPVYYVAVAWGLATLIPGLALAWRRLHDTNRSGLWVLIGLIPLVGGIILLVFYASASNPEGQRFDR